MTITVLIELTATSGGDGGRALSVSPIDLSLAGDERHALVVSPTDSSHTSVLLESI